MRRALRDFAGFVLFILALAVLRAMGIKPWEILDD